MRKKKIDEAELPSDNLAVYQLVNEKGGAVMPRPLSVRIEPVAPNKLVRAFLRSVSLQDDPSEPPHAINVVHHCTPYYFLFFSFSWFSL